MKKMTLIGLCLFISTSVSAELELDKKMQEVRKEFKKSNLVISKGNRILLNQFLKRNKADPGTLYRVEFVCRHLKDEDKCKFSKIDYRKDSEEASD